MVKRKFFRKSAKKILKYVDFFSVLEYNNITKKNASFVWALAQCWGSSFFQKNYNYKHEKAMSLLERHGFNLVGRGRI